MIQNDKENQKTITHDFPAWRERADFIIGANIPQAGISSLVSSEQIWAKQIAEDLFEVCCIPFFTYGLALGDYVKTRDDVDDKYTIDIVVEKNGHTTYRAWLASTGEWSDTIDSIIKLGCSVEVRWEKSRLIAIDAPSLEVRTKVEEFLDELEKNGKAQWEIAV